MIPVYSGSHQASITDTNAAKVNQRFVRKMKKRPCPPGFQWFDGIGCVDRIPGVERAIDSPEQPPFGLFDNVRVPWAQLADPVSEYLEDLRREAEGAVGGVIGTATQEAQGAIGNTISTGIREGITTSVERAPKTVTSIVTTGVLIGLGSAAALFAAGYLMGKK